MPGFAARGRRALLIAVALIALPVLWTAAKLARCEHSRHWLPSYARDLVAGRYAPTADTRHLLVLVCDHWEPGRRAEAAANAGAWLERLEPIAQRHRDSRGRPFQYTWFLPLEQRSAEVLALLSASVSRGCGEIEVHWHHRHDSASQFEADLAMGLADFVAAGALAPDSGAAPRFAFIHGNWALDNSRGARLCGIDREIELLQRHGCYADLTFPALGVIAQPRTINRIYYAQDTPEPKSYDVGEPARVGRTGRGLLMIPGPLGLDLRSPLVLLEYGALDNALGTGLTGRLLRPRRPADYFQTHRVQLWRELGVHVEGRRDWVFVKLHTHGMQDAEILLGGQLDAALGAIESDCRRRGIALHYITAREAYNLVRAAEDGHTGDPSAWYDYEIPPPRNRRAPGDTD